MNNMGIFMKKFQIKKAINSLLFQVINELKSLLKKC